MGGERVWRISDLIAWTTDYFKRRGIETARLDAELLLARALECSRLDLYLNYFEPVAPFHLRIYRELVRRRARREPVAYIIGEKEFMGLKFKVDRRVMIPRPETEILVEAALKRVGPEGRALDLGTGSGAIAVALAKRLPGWDIWATDISREAVEVARLNAEAHGVDVKFAVGDLFGPIDGLKFDLIVSNPPYIPSSEIPSLQPELSYEPRIALDGGEDGLEVLRRIVSEAWGHLSPGGLLCLEVGFDQARKVVELLEREGMYEGPEVIKDYSRIDRVVVARVKGR